MARALNLIREQTEYRREQFSCGLTRAGFQLVSSLQSPSPDDCVVVWNRLGRGGVEAEKFEAAGATVFVAENGYLGSHYSPSHKPYHQNGHRLFALSLHQHNGAGVNLSGGPERWEAQGISPRPWREDGEFILILPQRGIGSPGVAMPRGWAELAARQLQKLTHRPVKIRPHPGRAETPPPPLEDDLRGCWAVTTWGSCAALRAIVAGYPCFHAFPKWIGRLGSSRLDTHSSIEWPMTLDRQREAMLQQLSWAQFSLEEIAQGWPFTRLLELRCSKS